VSLVRHRDARADVGADVERVLELRAVADLAAGQMEIEGMIVEIGLAVDFGSEAATRAAERLSLLPPFAPSAETWARAVVLSRNWTRCAVWLHGAKRLEECLEHPGAAEPPEPLPDAVPFAILAGQRAPRYAVNSEVVDGLKKFPVIMPGLSPGRLRRIKHLQNDRPIALRHLRCALKGAFTLWVKVPPGQWSVGPVADRRFG
jgi:hypothetical protein